VRLSPLGTSATIWHSVPAPDGECGASGGITDKENRGTRREPVPLPLCPQIPHDLTPARTLAAVVGSRG
jgi:hypothetical protein